jgi:8-oxo-dGTP diphosphatase
MAETHAKGVTVTFTPVHDGRFLFVRRRQDDPVLGGYWCFPGGKVHVGETLAGALIRELQEETALVPTGRAFFVDSYLLGERVGVHFAVEVTHDKVLLDELEDHAWVESAEELATFAPRIDGIDTHLHYIQDHLRLAKNPEFEALAWRPLEQFDLVAHRFRNKDNAIV